MKERFKKLKELLFAIMVFCKQVYRLAKDTFRKRPCENVPYKDLAPVDDAEGTEVQINALKWAVNQTRIRNIALTGPYGSGKSSIIETFLRQNPLIAEKSIRISLATFTEITEEGETIISENLEEGILKQLFYKVKHSSIPQSRYRKLHKIEFWPLFRKTVLCSIAILFLYFIFKPNAFSANYQLILNAGPRIFNWLSKVIGFSINAADGTTIIEKHTLETIALLFFAAFMLGIMACLARIIQLFASRLSLHEVKLPTDTTVGKKENDSEEIFNKNMDEIVYFFEATRYRYVFIEDLDRFDDPEIFVQLRELNSLLNNCDTIPEPVVFIYAIRDNMFKSSERAKFFEFIIPVIPVMNSTNSCEYLLEMLQVSNDGTSPYDISRAYVLDVSPYISDMRVLQNIFNEFDLYRSTLKVGQNLSLRDEEIFSLIVFKNLYPDQFARLQNEDGIIKEAFNTKSSFIEEKAHQIEDEIAATQEILDNIDADVLNDIRELKWAMLGELTGWNNIPSGLRKGYYGTSYSVKQILDDSFNFQQLCSNETWLAVYGRYDEKQLSNALEVFQQYAKRIEYLRFASQENKNQLLKKLEENRKTLRDLSSQSLKQLLTTYGSDEVFEESAVSKNRFLVFLLRKGYITEEYSGAMNYFKANSITTGDRNFILSIKNQDPYPFSYALIKVAETIERLQVHEFSEKAILNFNLLEHMLSETRYGSQLEVFFKQLADESTQCWKFIDEFIDITKQQKRFVQMLSVAWPGFWGAVFDNGSLTYSRKAAYLGWLLDYTDIETLEAQNGSGQLAEFVISNDSTLQKLSPKQGERLLEVVPRLGIKFAKIQIAGVPSNILDRIFDERIYEINPAMIESIVAHKEPAFLSELQTANYTTIRKLGYNALTEYIHDNVETYIEQVVLQRGNVSESTNTVLDLLDRIIHNQDLCKQLVAHETFQITDISQAYKALEAHGTTDVRVVCDMLLSLHKVTASWENVHQYWQKFKMTDELTSFVAGNSRALSTADPSVLDDSVKKDIILSDISIDEFTHILECLKLKDFDIGLNEIVKEKLAVMICHQSFAFTAANFEELLEYAPEFCALYISKNQDAFAAIIDQISLNQPVFDSLIKRNDIHNATKELVIKTYGEEFIAEDTASLLYRMPLKINRTVFGMIWEYVPAAEKFAFMLRHLHILESADFDHYLVELGSPYDGFKRKSSRHSVIIADNKDNRALVERLQQAQHITSFSIEKQAFKNSKTEQKQVSVLKCRVKATD